MKPTTPNKPVEVAAGVIEDEGKILISKRAASAHQGGKWEFPGGKLERGETAQQALQRELDEELGIEVVESRPLIRIQHQYEDKSVVLSVFKVSKFLRKPIGKEGQSIRYVTSSELGQLNFPAANLAIIKAVQLPEICAITPLNLEASSEYFKNKLQTQEMVLLRTPKLPEVEYTKLASILVTATQHSNCRVILNSTVEEVTRLGADGFHLNSRKLMQLQQRPAGSEVTVSASCHSPQELRHAEQLGLDFVFLSPVQKTSSHPDASPLGWPKFKEWVADCALPVYALGGMMPDDLEQSFQNGAQGIAGISNIW